ncbi:GNAT family N-acetyltransferase [Jiella sp. MQZ9-1]|uniref:GNAT family N-acetyltransferase n=1 Tax=Jiella flava TaxID=2816857 RepID=A0A939JUG4_9HYPH|nr:GNAT family N-acetyltransferase [Jiella flava]MBO0663155.1 GNAT family N-acetyltransferase [Jiella flava]MCD2471573.1 GNAT family N-acetyltransferase [Jiella flava]
MVLPDGFTDIPLGKIAAIATILERREPPETGSHIAIDQPGWRFALVEAPDLDWYSDLIRRVGSHHLWYQRLIQSPDAITAKITSPATVIHALFVDGTAQGIAELDFSQKGAAELVYFGVTPELAGSGAAHVMMSQLVRFAFGRGIERLWLHTNTIDHPRAMAFYHRAGFTPVRQMLELADDPRLIGLFPRETAPQVPLFEPATSD